MQDLGGAFWTHIIYDILESHINKYFWKRICKLWVVIAQTRFWNNFTLMEKQRQINIVLCFIYTS